MDPREELELLRKRKRLQELEAKASGQASPSTTEPLQEKVPANFDVMQSTPFLRSQTKLPDETAKYGDHIATGLPLYAGGEVAGLGLGALIKGGGMGLRGVGSVARAIPASLVDGIGYVSPQLRYLIKGAQKLGGQALPAVEQAAPKIAPAVEELGARTGARELPAAESAGIELGPKPPFVPRQGNPEIESLLQPPKPSAPELPVQLEAAPPFRPRPTNPEVEAMIQPPKPPIPEAPVQLEPIPGFKPKPDVTIPEPIDPVMRGTQQYHSLGDAVPNKLTPADVAVPEPMKVPTEFATKLAEPKIPLKAKASLSDAMQSSPKEMPGFRGDPGKLSLEELMTPEAQSKVPGLVDMLLKARIK